MPVSSRFGGRVSPITGKWEGHMGVDIPAREGSPIVATKPLEVVRTDYQYNPNTGKGWGNYALVRDPQTGLQYRYAHLDENPNLKPGTIINPGETIGYTGNSGGSTGAHLHYEVLRNGSPIDPEGPQGNASVSSFSKDGGTLFNTTPTPDKNRRPNLGGAKPPAPTAPTKPPAKPAPQDATRPQPAPTKRPTRVPSSISPLHSIHDGG